MERFITGIAMYQIVFSSHYIIKTSDSTLDAKKLVSDQIADLKIGSSNASSPLLDPRRLSRSTMGQVRKNYEEPPESIILEESGEEDQPSALPKGLGNTDEDSMTHPDKQMRDTIIEQQFWGRIDAEHVMLVVNINGVLVLNPANRGEVIYHIELDDILHVMGSGNRLRLSFVIHGMDDGGSDIDS
jgi:hypothetical protein